MDIEDKRLFFGFAINTPWPDSLPEGRRLLEIDRHVTVAFLAHANLSKLIEAARHVPKIPFALGLGGIFDRPLFLPKRAPRVAAWHIRWLEKEELFLRFQKELIVWLKELRLEPREQNGEFLSHVTLAREPFHVKEWKETFQKLPLFLGDLHLWESLGSSRYRSHWSYPILSPFEEKEHTADIAFTIRGMSLQEMFLHAQLALSFHFPPLIDFISFREVENLDAMIGSLNQMICALDQEIGSPFKAVSYHGKLEGEGILQWEMIVDV
jgi:2'-5' RNA ligase